MSTETLEEWNIAQLKELGFEIGDKVIVGNLELSIPESSGEIESVTSIPEGPYRLILVGLILDENSFKDFFASVGSEHPFKKLSVLLPVAKGTIRALEAERWTWKDLSES